MSIAENTHSLGDDLGFSPSNEGRATIRGEKPLPVSIDFEVASAIAQPLTEKTLFTEQGSGPGHRSP